MTILLLLLAAQPAGPAFPFSPEEARKHQRAWAAYLKLPVEVERHGIAFVLVPPGTFLMGSPESEPGRGKDERQVRVTLTRAFYLGKHEVTSGQFQRYVAATRHVSDAERNGGGHAHDGLAVWKHRPGLSWRKPGFAGPYLNDDSRPVVQVSHNDARAFCAWLGKGYGLPTEAQWEWACRAGAATRFWWGDEEDRTGRVANVGDHALRRMHRGWPRNVMSMDDGHAFPAPVGSYRANAFGLHDMLGNVWEFCATRYGPYPKGPLTDPGDLDPKRGFAVRGGGWSNEARDCRCATRNADGPKFTHSNLGLRVMFDPAAGK